MQRVGSRLAHDDDDRKVAVVAAGRGKLLEHAVAVEPRHVQVEQDHVGVGHARQVEAGPRVGRAGDIAKAGAAQHGDEGGDVRGVVVDDDHPRVGEAVQHFPIMGLGRMSKQEPYG